MLQQSVLYHETFTAPARAVLTGKHQADVAIVGGGYVGLATALHLAESGLQVVVCEKDRIGDGPSGRNGGQVLSGFEADLEDVIAQIGLTDTQKIWQLIEQVRQQIIQRAQKADYRSGVLYAAMGPRQMEGLIATHKRLNPTSTLLLLRFSIRKALKSMSFPRTMWGVFSAVMPVTLTHTNMSMR